MIFHTKIMRATGMRIPKATRMMARREIFPSFHDLPDSDTVVDRDHAI